MLEPSSDYQKHSERYYQAVREQMAIAADKRHTYKILCSAHNSIMGTAYEKEPIPYCLHPLSARSYLLLQDIMLGFDAHMEDFKYTVRHVNITHFAITLHIDKDGLAYSYNQEFHLFVGGQKLSSTISIHSPHLQYASAAAFEPIGNGIVGVSICGGGAISQQYIWFSEIDVGEAHVRIRAFLNEYKYFK